MNRTLLQQALDALTVLGMNYAISSKHWPQADDAIAALREALAAPEPEPVMEFKGRRLTPEGTRECWGMLLCKPEQDPARGALLYAAPPAAPAPAAPVPDGWVMVPREPTPEMIAAYLAANTQYWAEVDALPRTPVTKWRQGTPSDATRESYRAMIAAHGITGGSNG